MATFRNLQSDWATWLSVDPKAEAVPSLSIYQHANNNPISNVDPDGDLPILVPIIAGAIGGGLNVWKNWDHIQQGGLWAGVKAFGIGAGAGVAGVYAAPAAAVGGSFGATVGSFAAAGAVGGGVAGSIEGFGNSLAFGDGNFFDHLGQGLTHGVLGAAGGAVIGAGVGAGAHWLSGLKAPASTTTSTTSEVFDEFIDPYAVHSVSGGGNVVKQGASITDGLTFSDEFVVTASRTSRSYADLIGHRAAHILNRHRFGAGKPGKTEFPSTWSDQRILYEVNRIANDPNAINGVGKWNSPYKIGVIDGTRIRVDFYPTNHARYAGRVSTAYPYGN